MMAQQSNAGYKPKFSILHTSARPDKWREIYDAWLKNADNPDDVEYVLVVDERWGFSHEDTWWEHDMERFYASRDRCVWNDRRRCYVDGVNLAAEHSTGEILVVNADDQFPCEHWDTEILKALAARPNSANAKDGLLNYAPEATKTAWVMAVNTGTPQEQERKILVAPILSRLRYEDLGYVFYPLYESAYADNDLYEQAADDGVLVEAQHLYFPHKHPWFDGPSKWKTTGVETDEALKEQNREEAFALGRKILEARRACGYREVKLPEQVATGQRKTISICCPGEVFRSEWVTAWTNLIMSLAPVYNIVPWNAHSSDVSITRHELGKAALGVNPDYILWIDDDNPVTATNIFQLIADLEHLPEADVVAGWCYTRSGNISCGRWEDHASKHITLEELMYGEHELKQVEWTGFPVVLMRANALGKAGKFPFLRMTDETSPWGCRGEDYSFCWKLAEAGGKIFVDRRVKVPHLKVGDCCGPQSSFDGTRETGQEIPAAEPAAV